jgi:hypothetical protein
MKITLTQALMLEPGDYIAMMMHNGTVLRKQILCIDLKVGKISLRRRDSRELSNSIKRK